jgi:hypothetical protein
VYLHKEFSSYLTENTLCIHYKGQPAWLFREAVLVTRVIPYTQIHCAAHCTVSYCYSRRYLYLPLQLKRFVTLLALVAFSLLCRHYNCCISHDDTCTEGVSLFSPPAHPPPPKPPSITLEHVVEHSCPHSMD